MITKIIFSIFVIVISWLSYYFIDVLDIFVVTQLHDHENCKAFAIPLAAEDFEIYGNLLISGIADRKHFDVKDQIKGSLLYFDSEAKTYGFIKLSKFPADLPFHPHGIYLFDNSTLYVLNHAYGDYGERIEIFYLMESKPERIRAKYVRSIVFPNEFLGKLNDIAVIKDGHFYVTEWIPTPDTPEGRDVSVWTTLKRNFYMMGKNTNLYYCKEIKGQSPYCVIQDTERSFNGVYISNNQLFAVESIERKIKIYDIKENFSLSFNAVVNFSHHIDNILKQRDGTFLATGIKRMIEFMIILEEFHSGKERSAIAGGVSRMSNDNGNWTVEEIIMQDKTFASVAAINDDTLIIGSATDNYLLLCPINK
ncbi:unnamed protein product [Blepharisma stoltei]|uniref:Uncharacterized protein n=1 Tax=Blepharisma stoltei TaxID=1481888 RepID=A0AAU9IPC5_9CILI|nr:unnamed protein product [Blepharisma stoltei]